MCGIVGVIGPQQAAFEAHQALLLLQHRGQDSAGILSYDRRSRSFHQHKDRGRVSKVFSEEKLAQLSGELAVGHTRYSTIGAFDIRDVQPITLGHPHGLGMVHNGNLVNVGPLREELRECDDRYLFTHNDLEIMLNLFAQGLLESKGEAEFERVCRSVEVLYKKTKGAYSVVSTVADRGMIAFCDPHGIRPLVMGRRKLEESERSEFYKGEYAYCFASESNTFQFLGYEICEQIRPGEVVFIDYDGNLKRQVLPQALPKRACMFEYVYFSTPESQWNGRGVYHARLQLGRALAERIEQIYGGKAKENIDLIVPVPETSRVSAIAVSEQLGIPYRELLIKNRYVQRSFILNNQEGRVRAVQLKLMPVVEEIKGKRILLVDDSIVRGTTSKRIIELVRECGAETVDFASTCPEIYHPCHYGIDFPTPQELVANRAKGYIREELGADKVIYSTIDQLKEAIGGGELCMACLDGNYPVDISQLDLGERVQEQV